MSWGSTDRGALRGAVLAALTTLLTATGHVAAGGAVPDLTLLVVLFPLLAVGVVALADHCRSTAGTFAALGVGQCVLHELMTLLHQHSTSFDPHGGAMLAGHGAVTVATAIALRWADRAMHALGAAVRRVAPRRLVFPPASCPLPALAVPGPGVSTSLIRALIRPLVRRGPPPGW